jgi:Protein of unknown function (DUF4238)
VADEHHHYVTRAYLEGFTEKRRLKKQTLLWSVDAKGKAFCAASKDVAKRQHYYTVKAPNPREIEDFFAFVENGTVPYLKRLLAAPELPRGADREYLVIFMAMHLLRVPAVRNRFRDTFIELQRKMLDLYAQHPESIRRLVFDEGGSAEDADRAVEAVQAHWDFKLQVTGNSDLSTLVKVMPKVWPVMVATGQTGFITGDRPVCMFAPGQGDFETGLAEPKVEVTMALNSKMCALFAWRHGESIMRVGDEVVAAVNGRTALQSEDFIFGADRDQLLDLHRRYREKLSPATLSVT